MDRYFSSAVCTALRENMNNDIDGNMNMKEATAPAKSSRHLDMIWLLLMAMTIANALIAEQAEPSLLVTLTICWIIVIKARLVIDHFMELKGASNYIYYLMNTYFYLFPILAILSWLFPEQLASLTTILP